MKHLTSIERELTELFSHKEITQRIPKKFFSDRYMRTPDGLLKVDVCGTSVLHKASLTDQIKEVPKKFFNQIYLMTPNSSGRTPMASIAGSGNFDLIPKELLTKENLTQGSNPPVIHELASAGGLKILPQSLLTKEILLTKDSTNTSAFIIAARVGKFEQIPQNLITKEILLHEDAYGATLAEQISWKGQLHLLDPKWIREDIILNNTGNPVMDSIVIYSEDYQNYDQLKMVLKLLNTTTLKKITEVRQYPKPSQKFIEQELKRKIKLQSLEKGLNKKDKNLEIF